MGERRRESSWAMRVAERWGRLSDAGGWRMHRWTWLFFTTVWITHKETTWAEDDCFVLFCFFPSYFYLSCDMCSTPRLSLGFAHSWVYFTSWILNIYGTWTCHFNSLGSGGSSVMWESLGNMLPACILDTHRCPVIVKRWQSQKQNSVVSGVQSG